MSVSFKIDDVEVNGTGGVRLHGQVADSRTAEGIREIAIAGLLTGSSTTDLQTKWDTLKTTVNTRDKSVQVSVDGTATNYLEEFFLSDGKTTGIVTFVSGDPTRIGTGTSMPIVMYVMAQEYVAEAVSGGTAGITSKYLGQVGDWRLMKIFSDARVESRVLTISFGTLFDKEAYGSYNFTAVSDVGGFAKFTFGSGDMGGITFKQGMKLFVSGSTNYNGTWEVTAVDTGADTVTTKAVYSGTDTGAAIIGEATAPTEVYDNARSSLLTLLGVGADGTRDTTTGLVLSGESKEEHNDLIDVVLNAEWTEKNYDGDIRNVQIALQRVEIPDWPSQGAGDPPVSLAVVVTFSVDKDQAGTTDPYPMWATIRNQVLADIKSAAEATDAVGPIDENVSWDKKAGTVAVNLSFIAKNTSVFNYNTVVSTHQELDFVSWKDPDGFDYIQTGAEPIMKIISITVTRVGVGDVELGAPTPVEPGYTFINISDQDGYQTPINRRNVGEVWTQTRTFVYKRFKLRTGADPRVRNPVTG